MITALLLGVAAVPEARAQSGVGGARLFQGQGQGSGSSMVQDSGRMTVLLFDANSMSLAEAQSAVKAAAEWSESRPDGALTSIVLNGLKLNVLSEFSADRAEQGALLRSEAFLNSLVAANSAPQAVRFGGSPATQDATQTAAEVDPQLAQARLRGIASLCTTVQPIPQRKAIMYFSSGLRGGGNQELLRAATNACNRANSSLYPIDARGLMNAIPGPAK